MQEFRKTIITKTKTKTQATTTKIFARRTRIFPRAFKNAWAVQTTYEVGGEGGGGEGGGGEGSVVVSWSCRGVGRQQVANRLLELSALLQFFKVCHVCLVDELTIRGKEERSRGKAWRGDEGVLGSIEGRGGQPQGAEFQRLARFLYLNNESMH